MLQALKPHLIILAITIVIIIAGLAFNIKSVAAFLGASLAIAQSYWLPAIIVGLIVRPYKGFLLSTIGVGLVLILVNYNETGVLKLDWSVIQLIVFLLISHVANIIRVLIKN